VFSPDGRLLISAGHDQAIWFQDVESWSPFAKYRGHLDQIYSIAISPDGSLLATGAKDGSIKIWNARPSARKDALQAILSPTNRVHFTPDSKRFVTVRSTDTGSDIRVWDTANAKQLAELSVEGDPVLDAMLLADRRRMAIVRKDERVELWDLVTQSRSALLVPPSDKPPRAWAAEICLRWLWEVEDGRKLISVQGIYGVGPFTPLEERGPLSALVHDLATLRPVSSWRFPFGFGVCAGNFSPDGKRFVAGGHDGEMVVCSLEDGSVVKTERAHGYALMKIEFLPNRRLMATAGMDGYLQLWDTDTWKLRRRLRADPNAIYSVAFHPDGTRVATGAKGSGFLTLWDVDSGRELVRLAAQLNGHVNRLLFADQDTLVGWAGWWLPKPDDQVAIWRAPSYSNVPSNEPRDGESSQILSSKRSRMK
jgi:WD40 repeat protein